VNPARQANGALNLLRGAVKMKVEVKKVDKLKRQIKVEVQGEDFLKAKKETYKELGKNIKVPGFRPGTVPLDVLERQHGEALKDEFLII